MATGNFIQHDGKSAGGQDSKSRRSSSKWLHKVMKSYYVANFMALVVLLDAYCTCAGIDARAAKHEPDVALLVISDVCLVLYTLELTVIFYVFDKWSVLKDWMMILDVIIVACGWLEIVMNAANVMEFGFLGSIKVTRVLRLVRIFRLIRLLRRVRTLKELHKLATMMATCMRTLLWCFLLCFVVMTGWAMLMVEVVHPIMQEIIARDSTMFSSCEFCSGATSSVMSANLLLFKTVIAGDGWGELAVPIITEHPATAIIFVGSQLTIVFGVVNLNVAVVVDTFAEARENDVQNLAEEMEAEIQQDSKTLAKVFERIDKDGSGQLTLEDLIEGARTDPAFQSRLRVMDIDENDLQQLFQMIDSDSSGTIEASEFIGPLSRWAHDSKTAPRFIKYNMLQTMHLQEDLIDLSADCFNELAARLDDLSRQLDLTERTAGPVSMTPTAEKVADLRRRVAESRDSRESRSVSNSETDSETTQDVNDDLHQPNKSPQVPFFFATMKEEDFAETKETNAMNHTQQKTLEFFLEETMRKLELKLDALLKDSKKIKVLAKYPRRPQPQRMSPRASDGAITATRLRANRAALHPEAFRSMYLDRRNSIVTRSGNASEALHSYRPQYTSGETFPATLDDAVASTKFSKDRVWRSVSRGRSNLPAETPSNGERSERSERSWTGSLVDWR
ncbi:unnamed protein product [Cladocopium goreaui]|uniref:Voltage-dependent N-type calcium channel subunit alpha-1B n=1 Tax=Cladocopium goreaui TaxID=2562237 RepID=A0A9P1FDY4_9DINO|nr:unnamed protein product [Cladocopium goreaui]